MSLRLDERNVKYSLTHSLTFLSKFNFISLFVATKFFSATVQFSDIIHILSYPSYLYTGAPCTRPTKVPCRSELIDMDKLIHVYYKMLWQSNHTLKKKHTISCASNIHESMALPAFTQITHRWVQTNSHHNTYYVCMHSKKKD